MIRKGPQASNLHFKTNQKIDEERIKIFKDNLNQLTIKSNPWVVLLRLFCCYKCQKSKRFAVDRTVDKGVMNINKSLDLV